MANMIGTTVTVGTTTTVTLTTGSLSTWVATGAQVNLYSGATSAMASATGGTTLTVLTSTTFTVPKANIASAYQNASGLQVLIAGVLTGMGYAFQQNCATIPPGSGTQSVAAGPLGFDQGFSIDLANAGLSGSVLWFMGDTAWATAAGQNRAATTNFVHNTVGIQTGGNYLLNYNTSGSPQAGSDTISFYGPTAGATSPEPVITLQHPGIYGYPVSGICVNQYCTLLGVQMTGIPGITFPSLTLVWINNISTGSAVTAPSSWNVVEVPNPFGELLPGPTNTTQWVKYTDSIGTWVLCYGEAGLNRNVYAFRFPFADLNISSGGTPYFGNIQYWCGPAGWIAADLMQSPQSVYPQLWPSFEPYLPFGVDLDDSGGLYQRTEDGIWVYVNEIVPGLGEMFCSENALITGPQFGVDTPATYKQFWYDSGGTQGSPSGFNTYGLRSHAEQKWAGQGTDDMLISYDTNSSVNGTNTETYWPIFLATSGL